jgi:hypothetical protein
VEMNKQIEEKSCKKCSHYEGCLSRFRAAKNEGRYELIDEEEYFSHSDDCDFLISQEEVAREIISEIEQAIMAHGTNYAMKRLAELKKKYEVQEDEQGN